MCGETEHGARELRRQLRSTYVDNSSPISHFLGRSSMQLSVSDVVCLVAFPAQRLEFWTMSCRPDAKFCRHLDPSFIFLLYYSYSWSVQWDLALCPIGLILQCTAAVNMRLRLISANRPSPV